MYPPGEVSPRTIRKRILKDIESCTISDKR